MLITPAGILWANFPLLLYRKWEYPLALLTTLWPSLLSCHCPNRLSGVLLLEPIPALSQGEGRALPGQVASSSQGPHWWAMWGSVSRSRTLWHAAQPCPELGFEPVTFQSLVDLLYLLSYNRPAKSFISSDGLGTIYVLFRQLTVYRLCPRLL